MVNILTFGLFSVFFIIDIYTNIVDGVAADHIFHEVLLCIFAISLMSWQIFFTFKSKKAVQNLENELLKAKVQFKEIIDQQLILWELSPGEKDISFLLIRGLSMKEIAELRNVNEKTVRQQATSIYRKSGLTGRQELSAFFLEDLITVKKP